MQPLSTAGRSRLPTAYQFCFMPVPGTSYSHTEGRPRKPSGPFTHTAAAAG